MGDATFDLSLRTCVPCPVLCRCRPSAGSSSSMSLFIQQELESKGAQPRCSFCWPPPFNALPITSYSIHQHAHFLGDRLSPSPSSLPSPVPFCPETARSTPVHYPNALFLSPHADFLKVAEGEGRGHRCMCVWVCERIRQQPLLPSHPLVTTVHSPFLHCQLTASPCSAGSDDNTNGSAPSLAVRAMHVSSPTLSAFISSATVCAPGRR